MNDTPNTIRLLIADDNAATRAATIALLEASVRRATVFEAANGEEAIRLAETLQPDVVLMDVQMPLMDGIAATQHIKQRWPAIRVVVHTIYPFHRNAALAAGADEFLIKGGSTDALLTTIFSDFIITD